MARRRGITGVASPFAPSNGRDPVAPERFFASASSPNIDWPGLVARGENSNGYTAQNPNGTQHVSGNGWNDTPWGKWDMKANGERWSGPIDWAKNGGNRTGE